MARACRGAHKCLPSANRWRRLSEPGHSPSTYLAPRSRTLSDSHSLALVCMKPRRGGGRKGREGGPGRRDQGRGGRAGWWGPVQQVSTQHRVRRWAPTVMPGRISRSTGRGTLVQMPGWLRGQQARSRTLSAGLLQSIDHSTPTRSPLTPPAVPHHPNSPGFKSPKPRTSESSSHQSFRFWRVLAGGLKGWRSSWRRATTERGSVVVPQSTFLSRTGARPLRVNDPPVLMSDPSIQVSERRETVAGHRPPQCPPSISLT